MKTKAVLMFFFLSCSNSQEWDRDQVTDGFFFKSRVKESVYLDIKPDYFSNESEFLLEKSLLYFKDSKEEYLEEGTVLEDDKYTKLSSLAEYLQNQEITVSIKKNTSTRLTLDFSKKLVGVLFSIELYEVGGGYFFEEGFLDVYNHEWQKIITHIAKLLRLITTGYVISYRKDNTDEKIILTTEKLGDFKFKEKKDCVNSLLMLKHQFIFRKLK